MNVLIALDSFKDCLASRPAGEALARGLCAALSEARCRVVEVADGGEGTIDAILARTGGRRVSCTAHDPLGRRVETAYARLHDGRTAIVELAAVVGLQGLPTDSRDAWLTSSFGAGEVLREALESGAERIVLSVGGSAVNDGGAGLLQALGARFIDSAGRTLTTPLRSCDLERVADVDSSRLITPSGNTRVEVACDVTNPLCGPRGASRVFGPQKGLSAARIAEADTQLGRLYDRLEDIAGRPVRTKAGAGAAGGVAAAVAVGLGAVLQPGAALVLDLIGFDALVEAADLVITGEGCIDAQTLDGKTPLSVARRAKAQGKPVIAIGGSLGPGAEAILEDEIDAFEALVTRPQALATALSEGGDNLERCGRRLGQWIRVGRGLS